MGDAVLEDFYQQQQHISGQQQHANIHAELHICDVEAIIFFVVLCIKFLVNSIKNRVILSNIQNYATFIFRMRATSACNLSFTRVGPPVSRLMIVFRSPPDFYPIRNLLFVFIISRLIKRCT